MSARKPAEVAPFDLDGLVSLAAHRLVAGRWRVVMTDSESPDGIARVCLDPAHPDGVDGFDDGGFFVRECCDPHVVETHSEPLARFLVAALNGIPALSDGDGFAWHTIRLFIGPHPLDPVDCGLVETTHPAQCGFLPPGAACWFEHTPFRRWWPAGLGTFRIRPVEYVSGGSEDGPDMAVTLEIQSWDEDGQSWREYAEDDRPAGGAA